MLISVALVATVLALCSASAPAGWWDDAGAARQVTFTEINARTGELTDIPILLDARVDIADQPGAALPADLMGGDWITFAARPGRRDQSPASTAPIRLVAAAGSAVAARAAELDPTVTVVVRGVRRGQIDGVTVLEVLSLTVPGDPLTPEEAALLARADKLLGADNPAGAEKLYRELLRVREFAVDVAAWMHKQTGLACGRLGRYGDAAQSFRRATLLDPKDEEARRGLELAEHKLDEEDTRAGAGADPAAGTAPDPDSPLGRLAGPRARGASVSTARPGSSETGTPKPGSAESTPPSGTGEKPDSGDASTPPPPPPAPEPPASEAVFDPDHPPPPPRPRLRGPR